MTWVGAERRTVPRGKVGGSIWILCVPGAGDAVSWGVLDIGGGGVQKGPPPPDAGSNPCVSRLAGTFAGSGTDTPSSSPARAARLRSPPVFYRAPAGTVPFRVLA